MIHFATSILMFNKIFTKIEIGSIIEDICCVSWKEFVICVGVACEVVHPQTLRGAIGGAKNPNYMIF